MDSPDSSGAPSHIHPAHSQHQQPPPRAMQEVPSGSDPIVRTTSAMPPQIPRSTSESIPTASVSAHPYTEGSSSGSRRFGIRVMEPYKKRGRPRKNFPVYSIDGTPSFATLPTPRVRGRPPGSKNRLNLKGEGFTPYVILVNTGQNIMSEIMAFTRQEPRTICVLSATGAISNVSLLRTGTPTTVTYEGYFEILSLSGSFMPSDGGGLSVSFADMNGNVFGGVVGEILIAASPVQIIIGRFSSQEKNTDTPVVKVESDPGDVDEDGSGQGSHRTMGHSKSIEGTCPTDYDLNR